jgi:hypothetical protein
MAAMATCGHGEHVNVLQLRLLWRIPAQVRYQPAHILEVESRIQCKHIAMAA